MLRRTMTPGPARAALAPILAAALLGGCVVDDLILYPDGGAPSRPRPDAGTSGVDAGAPALRLDTPDRIFAHLEGNTLSMGAAAIPSHPNGFDENVNFGQASQCLHAVQMSISARQFTVRSELGTLRDAPMPEDVGRCDRAAASGEVLSFVTTAALIENVTGNGECFDLTLTYAGFGQEGRGAISADGREFRLELYFRDQAIGHRCADGPVGAPSVTLNQEPFVGSAVQRYALVDRGA